MRVLEPLGLELEVDLEPEFGLGRGAVGREARERLRADAVGAASSHSLCSAQLTSFSTTSRAAGPWRRPISSANDSSSQVWAGRAPTTARTSRSLSQAAPGFRIGGWSVSAGVSVSTPLSCARAKRRAPARVQYCARLRRDAGGRGLGRIDLVAQTPSRTTKCHKYDSGMMVRPWKRTSRHRLVARSRLRPGFAPRIQLTLPEPIADALEARPDDLLLFEVDPAIPGTARVRLISSHFAGAMTGTYGTTDEVKAFLREEHAAWGE